MPTIRIPVPLRKYAEGQREVSVSGSSAGAALADLTAQFPELSEYIYDDSGDLVTSTYESMNVLLNRRDLRELQGMDTSLAASDQLLILRTWPAAISGGRQFNQPVGAEAPPG